MKRRGVILLDCLILFCLALTLNWPYLRAKYTDKWPSIESTFVADARFLIEHWPHPQWQPLWYGGTRFDYIYPPALRYGTAAISKLTGYWPVKAYHFYTILFYCLGFAGVYLLVRAAGRPRGAAWLAAVATALMSPSLLFMTDMRIDSGQFVPVRFGSLIRYGEGPHITALSLVPFALAFAWMAFEKGSRGAMVASAIFCAAVVSNNFYGATALAMFYPILVWSFWITRQKARLDNGTATAQLRTNQLTQEAKALTLPAIAIPLLAYGLTAFWLVPSYVQITTHNMQYVSEPGNWWSVWAMLTVGMAYVVMTNRWARSRPEWTWPVFVIGSVAVFGLTVQGNHCCDFRLMGEPSRLIPELDMVLILGVVLFLEWLWRRQGILPKVAAGIVAASAFATTIGYLKTARDSAPLWGDYTTRVEYRVSDWLWKNMPDARVYPSGSVRFWLNVWHDQSQLDGGSVQGMLNPVANTAGWEISGGGDPEMGILWMQALGVDAMYVAGPQSEEPYKDVQHAERFAKQPVLFDDGQGNTLYGIPRRYAVRARVVETNRMGLPPGKEGQIERPFLRRYVEAIERGPEAPVTLRRLSTDAMAVSARVAPGQSVVVQESYDPNWQAWAGGKQLPVRKDPMGFLLVETPPGEQSFRLGFVTPLENRAGRVMTAISVLALIKLVMRSRRREQSA